MKTKNIIYRLSLLFVVFAMTTSAWAKSDAKDAKAPPFFRTIKIYSESDWKHLCKRVEDGESDLKVFLMRDISLSDPPLVGEHRPFIGNFHGNGHTIRFNHGIPIGWRITLFKSVQNATIENLNVKASIWASSYKLSGLVCDAAGRTTISNCVIDADIKCAYEGGASEIAGMVTYVLPNANVTINDCIVKGKFNATTSAGQSGMSGFVHTMKGSCTLNNCLYFGENNATAGNTFAPSGTTLNNCYFTRTCGTTQGMMTVDLQLESGYLTYLLQKGRSNMVWGQKLGTDSEPMLTTDESKRICKVAFTYNGSESATRYANKGGTVASLPIFIVKNLVGLGYNEHHYYAIAFADNFSTATIVTADMQVAFSFTEKDHYEITSAADWKTFCDAVNDGQNKIDAKLMRNVDLGSEINMVGNDSKEYGGTFDGQNHTLKLDWSNTNGLLAPFYRVENTTIRNLRTEGNIKSSYSLLSGLILTVYGKTTITNCVSAVNITSTYNGSGCVIAGMILEIPYGAVVTFTDCIVKGKYNTTLKEGSISVSGFISGHNGTSTFNNCIYLGDNVPGGYTFAAYTYLGPTLNNCYYLNACGIAQGTKITAEQLKNGEVTKKLQNNRTDKCYWAQQLGEMPDFYNAADKSKANYVYYDAAKKGWMCDDFRLTDGQPLPIGLDFTAATVTYERNFNGTQKATLCLPYDLYAQGFKAYTLSGGNKNEVHFKEVDDKLPAYTPYYITANGMPQLGGRNIEVKAYKADKMTTPAAGYKFTGTVAGVSNATAAADNAYILQDDGKFHKVTTTNSAATIPAYRAYIICPPQASGAKQLSVVLDGETTGIGNVTNEATDGKNGPVYDLQGRRVADRLDDARHRLPAGVYIVGCRKVVVK